MESSILESIGLEIMGGSIFLSIIKHFSIPVDSITCFLLLFNFTIVGVLSVFSGGFPKIMRQCYMVCLGIFVAAWSTKLPEWTTWTLLVALAVYDLVAVLAPGGPLKLLVDLASTRDEELPALVYEARPVAPQAGGNRGSNMGLFIAGFSDSSPPSGSVELQPLSGDSLERTYFASGIGRNDEARSGRDEGERSPLVGTVRPRHSSSSDSSEYSVVAVGATRSVHFGNNRESEIEEMSPLVEILGSGNQREQTRTDDGDNDLHSGRGIRLGLGDFVFYSVLVGRAAMYDLMSIRYG